MVLELADHPHIEKKKKKIRLDSHKTYKTQFLANEKPKFEIQTIQLLEDSVGYH